MASEKNVLKNRLRRANKRINEIKEERVSLRIEAAKTRLELIDGLKDAVAAFPNDSPNCKEFLSRFVLLETIIAEEIVKIKRLAREHWNERHKAEFLGRPRDIQKKLEIEKEQNTHRIEMEFAQEIYTILLKNAIREAQDKRLVELFEKLSEFSKKIGAISKEIKNLRKAKIHLQNTRFK
ncbi:MAG: hypothetical protein Q4A27_00530 [bacterium]|nr:hypothetical protein [bacterium]